MFHQWKLYTKFEAIRAVHVNLWIPDFQTLQKTKFSLIPRPGKPLAGEWGYSSKDD